ncbi:hypothetical protein P4O66_018712, partial [Electrophorus voltai]
GLPGLRSRFWVSMRGRRGRESRAGKGRLRGESLQSLLPFLICLDVAQSGKVHMNSCGKESQLRYLNSSNSPLTWITYDVHIVYRNAHHSHVVLGHPGSESTEVPKPMQ